MPTLAGGGVTLRPWRVDDANHLVSAWKDPEVIRWTPVPDDPGPEKATIWIAGAMRRLATAKALDLVAVDDDGTAVGEVGLSGLDHDRRVALIGWWTAAHARRRGIATQAVGLLVEWALGPPLDLAAILARIHPDNEGSLAVARSAGFRTLATRDDQEVVMVATAPQRPGPTGVDWQVLAEGRHKATQRG
jgi:RimJ/RimL family protein N-acetyltransferase